MEQNAETTATNPGQHKDVLLWRGGFVESAHSISAVVVNEEGDILYKHRDPYLVTNLRSSAKPFQVIPLLQAIEEIRPGYDLTPEEIAVMTASHSGAEEHVAVVSGFLEKAGLPEELLQCGRHPPFDKENQKLVGDNYTELHNNCSGKHAAMLAICKLRGYPMEDYFRPDHPLQKLIIRTISLLCSYPEKEVGLGVDGCGVPVFYLPLYNMALGYARLSSDRELVGEGYRVSPEILQRVVQAMYLHPYLVAGKERLDTELMIVANRDRPVMASKVGAEGLSALSLLEEHQGLVVKVEDGGGRAAGPAVLEVLAQMGVLDSGQLHALERHHKPEIKNRKEEVVGHLVPDFRIKKLRRS